MNWRERLSQKRTASKMTVTRCPLDKLGGGWHMEPDQSAFCREDGKFHRLEGVMAHCPDREVTDWDQPLFREQGPGVLVLVTDGEFFLVTMSQEPGNPANKQYVLLGPPLQASRGNWEQAHGGKRPPRAEFNDDPRVAWADGHKDGGRFIGSMNRMGVLRVPTLFNLQLLPNELVLSRHELKLAFLGGEVNLHLREMIGFALLLLD
ncbi:MAG: hypothetical protein A2534_04125 [Candidatus Magasanikbacteria bacterium RIFOXYD2_FULL_39_9]|uniref:dTDP-4-dehydro-6-deoxy-alpha-D-glucopyranose 2,3-dehydratase domain-containing protein n=1 Tax=Candidatus Magasanikbacteria bacterium RIFOXYD1_FULL_40_23 TaxID=1798705 RepID=A0A1F6P9P1_9BACT|nr:MAG: hypothetical protein A2534_04125 [Candidatus Magasanikbacteria bacterium RIFOXYD2_FULL_39_9]OGH92889.1 MAG: hypothetical protein A2563_04460 [Candidatus Magasanikbacteria bacterium RIFOXYD1_FULL_40_23]